MCSAMCGGLQVHAYLNKYAAHPSASIPEAALANLNLLYEAAGEAIAGPASNGSAPCFEQPSRQQRSIHTIAWHNTMCMIKPITPTQHGKLSLQFCCVNISDSGPLV